MARLGVDYETIKQAAVKLLSQGAAPSVQKIRELLGTGSNTTIAEHLKVWRDEYAKRTIHHLPANMPKELISTFEVLWQTAMEQAHNQLSEYKQALESERGILLQKDRDTEQSIKEMGQKIFDLSATVEQEMANKQKLRVELAVTNDRLSKQTEEIIQHKNQYEERLKRAYEERDSIIVQKQQLQNEIKLQQEKISMQTEQHQNLIAQQNALHEQSEIRWLNLIDQSKQETKEMQKRFEIFRTNANKQINQFKIDLSNAQLNLRERSANLKVALEQVDQLKQQIKIMEPDLNDARITIIKLQEKINLQNVAASEKMNIKKNKLATKVVV
jgi:chromosome segregation ATPase